MKIGYTVYYESNLHHTAIKTVGDGRMIYADASQLSTILQLKPVKTILVINKLQAKINKKSRRSQIVRKPPISDDLFIF